MGVKTIVVFPYVLLKTSLEDFIWLKQSEFSVSAPNDTNFGFSKFFDWSKNMQELASTEISPI